MAWDTSHSLRWERKKGAHHTSKSETSLGTAVSVCKCFCTQLFVWSGGKAWNRRQSNPTFIHKSTLNTDSRGTSFPHVIKYVDFVCQCVTYTVTGEVQRSACDKEKARRVCGGVVIEQSRCHIWVPCFSQQWNLLSFQRSRLPLVSHSENCLDCRSNPSTSTVLMTNTGKMGQRK